MCVWKTFSETGCFSLVIHEKSDVNKPVDHATFNDTPLDPIINIDGKRWRKTAGLENSTAMNTIFLSIAVFSKRVAQEDCLLELLANTFRSCTPVDFIIVECPDLEYAGRKSQFY